MKAVYLWCAAIALLVGQQSASAQEKDKIPAPPVLEKKVEAKKEEPKKEEVKKEEPTKEVAKKEEPKQVVEEKKEKTVTEKLDELTASLEAAKTVANDAKVLGDTAWMLVSTAFVLLMVPGLALFYGGMVRRKNVLATMMQSMICLSVVGVFWIAIGYALAFGDPWIMFQGKSILGWSPELIFMRGVGPTTMLPGYNIPVYVHMAYQGMFAIITPALISGALAERIKFKPYLIFVLIWMVVVYCPLAQAVWSFNFNWGYNLTSVANYDQLVEAKEKTGKAASEAPDDTQLKKVADAAAAKLEEAEKTIAGKKEAYVASKIEAAQKGITEAAKKEEAKVSVEKYYANGGTIATGYFGDMGALDFAGGTVVHIAAGFSSLACFLALRKRFGYPAHAFHPNSMVLTLTGAGILWFGWFGFNGGSGLGSGTLASSAFTATQAAAAAAGLSWTLVEWIHRGKPTALGFASGVVAGLVAVTPAAGFVLPWAGLVIGLISGAFCYGSVFMKSIFKYDDSLDAFGVHGVGGFLGAVLTGFLCYWPVNKIAILNDGYIYATEDRFKQVGIQFLAAATSAVLAFVVSFILVKLVDALIGFTVTEDEETMGLDRVEHNEVGFDLGLALEAVSMPINLEPRAAVRPPNGVKHYSVVVDGASGEELTKAWSELCVPNATASADFKAVYPNLTTYSNNRFKFRGGDANATKEALKRVFESKLKKGVTTKVE